MEYLSFKDVVVKKLVCSHPKVLRCWQWGGGSINGDTKQLTDNLTIVLNDEKNTREDFRITKDNDYSEAEAWLKTIPET